MSRQGRHAVILTNDGDFRSVRLRRSAELSIGQTVTSNHLSYSFHLNRHLLAPVMAVGFSILCFASLSQSTYQSGKPVAAYVSVDLVSSIEASVDKDFRVISVQAQEGGAGEVIADSDDFRGMTFRDFSSALFRRLYQQGDLKSNSLCVISTAFTNQVTRSDRWHFNRKLMEAFSDGASQFVIQSGAATRWVNATMDIRKSAKKTGLPLGKYLLYLQTNARGKILSVHEAKQISVEKMAEISNRVSDSWRPLVNKLSSGIRGGIIENMSLESEKQRPIFQNPFQKVRKGNTIDNSSSYYKQMRSPQDFFPGRQKQMYA